MSTFTLSKPQRRKRVYGNREAPFPVPIASQTNTPSSDDKWYYYTANIVDGFIVVQHSGDVEQLYKMGFFGKGTLSRHRPQYRHITPSLRWPVDDNKQRSVKVISRRKYLQRKAWAHSGICHHEEEIELLPVTKKVNKKLTVAVASSADKVDSVGDHTMCQTAESDNKNEEIEQYDKIPLEPPVKHSRLELACDGDEIASKDNSYQSDWGQESWGQGHCHRNQRETDPWAETSQTESTAFWGMSDPEKSASTGTFVGQTENVAPHIVIQTTMEHNCVRLSVGEESKKSVACQSLPNEVSIASTISGGSFLHDDVLKSEVIFPNDSKTASIYNIPDTRHRADAIISMASAESRDDVPSTYHTNEELRCNLDERCLVDDEEGDVLVVDDTDDSDVELSMDTRLSWQPVVKCNPHVVTEELQLSMEETFFLSYALGCLVVYDENQKVLDLMAMWQRFCTQDDRFLFRYVVYHNLRSKGWVPKSGLKYGTDFVVYKEGPAFYHSTYSVLVRHVTSGDLREKHDGIAREHTWTSLAAINRITEQVSKDLMICYVIEPEGLTQTDKKSPACLTRYTVQEVVLKRSISKQERENAEYVLMP